MDVTDLSPQSCEQLKSTTWERFTLASLAPTNGRGHVGMASVKQNAEILVPDVVRQANDLRRLVKGKPGLELPHHSHAAVSSLLGGHAKRVHQPLPAELRIKS